MRKLLTGLTVAVLFGCGGGMEAEEEELLGTTSQAMLADEMPNRKGELKWELVWDVERAEFRLMPVEERFFYRVEPTANPPTMPPPPCPNCRR